MTDILQVVDVPDRLPADGSMAILSRRAAQWLADRANGIARPSQGTVRWIPKTEAEQAAWRGRKKPAPAGRTERAYVTWRSAGQAYRQRLRKGSPEPHKGPPATTPEPAPVAPAGEGVERIVSRSPSGRHEAGSQAGSSNRTRSSPRGGPTQSPRRKRAARKGTPGGQYDINAAILRWLGFA